MLRTLVALSALVFGVANSVAIAQLTFCNKTTVPMNIAITYQEDSVTYTQGWYSLIPNQCKLLPNTITGRYVYVRGEESYGPRRWEGPIKYCVSDQAFKYVFYHPCDSPDNLRGFQSVDTQNLARFEDDLTCADCPPPSPTLRPSPLTPPPEWQVHLDWCKHNRDAGGAVNCQDDYAATYPACLISGGRSCLMGKAVQSAHDHDCENAFKLALICQCHSAEAQSAIRQAGVMAVCNYLGPPDPPQLNATPPNPRPNFNWPGTDYYVSMRYTCQDSLGYSGGDCTITQHSSNSCQAARNGIADTVNKNGDVCKHCPGSQVTDNTKSVVGSPKDVTGGGPCVPSQ